MKVRILNKSDHDLTDLTRLTQQFFPFAQKTMGFDRTPSVTYTSDPINAKNPLGKTAHYEPQSMNVAVYVDGRHTKDILRSLSHELVHHTQNCRGEFDNTGATKAGYAQEDSHLREMEREAYELGNLCFRDWEDSLKSQMNLQETIYRTIGKGDQKMSIKDWKNKELNTNLMERWGYTKKEEPKKEEAPKKEEKLNEEVDAYMNNQVDYKTGQKHLPTDLPEEDQESSDDLHEDPQSVEARERNQEARTDEEERLRETIREIIKELS
tara:strand:- start:33 stop:833 length:801 start_codon:yes stop_codon:yes gene_type:complete